MNEHDLSEYMLTFKTLHSFNQFFVVQNSPDFRVNNIGWFHGRVRN